MKYLAWALITIGLAAILFGFESCRHVREFYTASQAKDLHMNTEGDPVAMASAENFIRIVGCGIVVSCVGLYLRNPKKRAEAKWEKWLKWIILLSLVLAILIGLFAW